MKAWKNITLNFPGLKLEGIVEQLSYLNVLSVTVKDKPALEKSDWFDDPHTPLSIHGDAHVIILLMEASRSTNQLLEEICLILDLDQTPAYSEDVFEDRNWVTHTQAQFKEIQVSKTLRILPPWESKTEFVGKTLIIEPGSGFGTGSHPTTQLCLRWLEKNLNKNDSVLDYGCGSGILSIGAKLLGADHVEGVEIDQLAINNANQNNELNGTAIPFQIYVYRPPLLTSELSTEAFVGLEYAVFITAEDLYGKKLSSPESIQIDSASFNYYNLSDAHLFKWTPRDVDKGDHEFIIRITDEHGFTTLHSHKLSVFTNPCVQCNNDEMPTDSTGN